MLCSRMHSGRGRVYDMSQLRGLQPAAGLPPPALQSEVTIMVDVLIKSLAWAQSSQ